jgi:TolB-like protein
VELLWMTVLSRDGGEVRLAYSAMGFHDLSSLATGLRRAPTLEALEALLDKDGDALVAEALAKFKPVPMPAWWRPQTFAPPQPVAVTPAPPARGRLADGAQVAVLDFKRGDGFSKDDARYLTDVVRGAVLSTASRLAVMTRENLLVLLQASGKDLAECEGECEVDTGRRIGADAVVSGDLLKFGARLKLSLRLHETKGGRLLAAAVASGATLEELDAEVQKRAAELLAGQR